VSESVKIEDKGGKYELCFELRSVTLRSVDDVVREYGVNKKVAEERVQESCKEFIEGIEKLLHAVDLLYGIGAINMSDWIDIKDKISAFAFFELMKYVPATCVEEFRRRLTI